MEFLTYGFLFLMGILLGSFFTLAVYRIPRGENITHEHSYCPNCHHKLGILDLIPVFSYLFLRGKCRYCHNKIRIRYFLLEILSGITLVCYGYAIGFDLINIDVNLCVTLGFAILYFVGLFMLAGIDKERRDIQPSVLWYEIFVAMGYMIYICTLQKENAYIYVIYLSLLILAILWDTTYLRKKATSCYGTKILILLLTMLIFAGAKVMVFTLGCMLIFGLLYHLFKILQQKRYKFRQKDHIVKEKLPTGWVLCVFHIISILMVNWMEQVLLL